MSSSGNIADLRRLKAIWDLLKDAAAAWDEDHAWRLGAALAYFTVFSLAPLLIIAVVFAGIVFGQQAAEGHLVTQLSGVVGTDEARFIEMMIRNVYTSGSTLPATVIGIVTVLLGGTAVFAELRDALNTVWHIRETPIGTVKAFLRARVSSLLMILGIGALLLASLFLSVVMAAMSASIGGVIALLGGIVDFLISLCGFAVLFALIFKYLPNVILTWKDVIVGASFTSLLFSFGKLAIGLYLGRSAVSSPFGAAGSLAIVLLWAFYSSQIFLFGAEFTRLYAKRFGSGIRPGKNAVLLL
ncbi:MAG TPA: YihY/virulence factor BrkB family protein [Bacteroidota bacterium]|nr:YihY/virulence factor BrkB family protein [Bacteroidota bacterium]